MRRVVGFLLVVLLSQVTTVGGGWTAAAQESESIADCTPGAAPPQLGLDPDESYYWEGVCRPIPPDEPAPAPVGGDFIMQPYTVFFKEGFAAVPDSSSGDFRPEFMVVIVRDGTFALDVKRDTPGRVTVTGAGNEIPILSAFAEREPYYTAMKGAVLVDRDGNPCVRGCEIPPETVVQLETGDRIVAEEGAICVYCLLGANNQRKGETGLLEVFVLRRAGEDAETFSWIDSWDRAQRGELRVMRSVERSTALGWAYFDPKTGCKDG
ncbi:MAG: hypothetical protein H0T18_03700 [Chloroflexia bacterium]|nr:hypothetical protein [Chloroflexia bacterium]